MTISATQLHSVCRYRGNECEGNQSSATSVANAGDILEGGNILVESTKAFIDLKVNPATSGSPEQAVALLATAGVLASIVGKLDQPFVKALAGGIHVNESALGAWPLGFISDSLLGKGTSFSRLVVPAQGDTLERKQ